VEADGPYSHPAALDTDVAGLDVAFGDPGLRLAPGGGGAEVMGLELHLRSTINAVGFWDRCFFGKTNGRVCEGGEKNHLAGLPWRPRGEVREGFDYQGQTHPGSRRGLVADRRGGSWSGSGGAGDRAFEHGLDCLSEDDDSVAKADGRQPASTDHFISKGTADAQKFSSFFNGKGQAV